MCADLEPEVAVGLIKSGRDDIWCYRHDTWGVKDVPIPPWATNKREDVAAWEVNTSTNKIRDAAQSGCSFCEILLKGLREYASASEDEPAVIIFCQGDVLRLHVGAALDDDDSGVRPTELEFYSEKGKINRY